MEGERIEKCELCEKGKWRESEMRRVYRIILRICLMNIFNGMKDKPNKKEEKPRKNTLAVPYVFMLHEVCIKIAESGPTLTIKRLWVVNERCLSC